MSAPGFLDSISPWTSRSTTPKPGQAKGESDKVISTALGKHQHTASDHRVNHRHRLQLRDYPEDCPPLDVRWFYAVDVSVTGPDGNDSMANDST